MGLDCVPRPYKDGRPDQEADCLTHLEDQPCPFAADDFVRGCTCCSLRGIAAEHLSVLGKSPLRDAMFGDMSPEEAVAFADELRVAADSLEHEYANASEKPKGAECAGHFNVEKGHWEGVEHFTFEQALASIRQAARWYEKVGTLGYGVHAWW